MPGRDEFYEDLALWSTLSIGRNQRNDVKRQIWQRFLDDLCYLCDTEPGGRTTVSIAVSEFEGGQCYWISANEGSQKAVGQLTLILEELEKVRDPFVDLEEIKDKILFAGMRRSSMKVRNYLKELRRYIRVIETRISHPKTETFRALLQLETYRDISTAAYRLRCSQDYLELKDHIARNPGDPESRHIRHYLGRLASWAKSVDFVVQASHSHSLIQAPIKIRELPSQRSTILAGPIQKKALDALVASLFRAGVDGARELCESRWLPVLDIYTKRWQSLKLKTAVHAEIIILDYFHRHRLPFAHGKRYIGCSKPSCFCCGVYMASHPLRLEQRRCHNNVWVKWTIPRRSRHGFIDALEDRTEGMAQIGDMIKQKIREELAHSALIDRQRLFDSATDLSASLPTTLNSMVLRSLQSDSYGS